MRFSSQLLFLAGSQSALGGRWLPLKALSGMASAAGEGERGGKEERAEEAGDEIRAGSEEGRGDDRESRRRFENKGPGESCLTWVNSQLADAKPLHCVVLVIGAGPAVSHRLGMVCSWVKLDFFCQILDP